MGGPAPTFTGGGTVSFQWAGPSDVPVGQVLELRLQLNAAMPLRGMPLDLSYDKQRLQYLDAAEGDFFRRDGAPTSFTQSVDAANGRARVSVLRNQSTGIAGQQGTVLVVRFKALSVGNATVKLEAAQPVHLDGTGPQVAPSPAWAVRVH